MDPLNLLINTQREQTATDHAKFAEPSYRVVTQTVSLRVESTEPERFVEPEHGVGFERSVESERSVEAERNVESRPLVLDADTADVPAEIVAGLTSFLPQDRVEALAKLTQSGAKEIFKLIVNSFADVSPDVRNAAVHFMNLTRTTARSHSVAPSQKVLRSRAETSAWPWPHPAWPAEQLKI